MIRRFVLAGILALASVAQAQLRVIATTTDLKSLTEALGGADIAASHLIPPTVNAEDYQPKPQDLARVKAADLIIRVGVDYDLWLDRLLAQAPDALRRGGSRHVDASSAIALVDVRSASLGAGDGHAHGSGNPHYWLDPNNAAIITGTLLEALARIDPGHAKAFERRRIEFLDSLERKRPEWEARLAPLQGKAIVAYHNTWAYFARRYRLRIVGFVEVREGVAPTPAHLAGLIKTMREQQVTILIRQPHESSRDVDFLALRTNARIAILAASIGAAPQATDYVSLIEHNVQTLARASR